MPQANFEFNLRDLPGLTPKVAQQTELTMGEGEGGMDLGLGLEGVLSWLSGKITKTLETGKEITDWTWFATKPQISWLPQRTTDGTATTRGATTATTTTATDRKTTCELPVASLAPMSSASTSQNRNQSKRQNK